MSYNPNTGRFLSQDPIAFQGGDTNLVRYVGNDPVNGTDPTGLQATTFTPSPPGVTPGKNPQKGPIGSLDVIFRPPSRPDIVGTIPVLRPGYPTLPGRPPLNTSFPPNTTAVGPTGGGFNIKVPSNPNNQLVGVTGATPCVGVILRPTKPGKPFLAYHFGAPDDISAALNPVLQGGGYEAVVVGSVDDSAPSLRAFYDLFFALGVNNIPIKAYIQAYSGHVDNKGNLYCTVPKTMK